MLATDIKKGMKFKVKRDVIHSRKYEGMPVNVFAEHRVGRTYTSDIDGQVTIEPANSGWVRGFDFEDLEFIPEITVPITFNLNVEHSDIGCIICTAVEGGSNYWCREYKATPPEGLHREQDEYYDDWGARVLINGGHITFLVDNDETKIKYDINLERMLVGIRKFVELRLKQGNDRYILEGTSDLNAGMIDAGDADMIIQYAQFGEVVYG